MLFSKKKKKKVRRLFFNLSKKGLSPLLSLPPSSFTSRKMSCVNVVGRRRGREGREGNSRGGREVEGEKTEKINYF